MTRFYQLPARHLVSGLSTDDGQDVLSVRTDGDYVSATVYTPRPDNPERDAENKATPETRVYSGDELVHLAESADTHVVVDGQ